MTSIPTSSSSSSSSSKYEVILCTTPHHLREATRIRLEVFIAEQGFDLSDELDDLDPISAHFLLIDTARPSIGLGTLRWVPYPSESVLETSQEAINSKTEDLPLGRPQTTEELTRSFVSAGQAKLGRLAASKEVRGKKLGAKLVVDSEKWIREILASNLAPGQTVEVGMKLHSQMQVVQFYQRLGYQSQGDPFDEDGAPHMLCQKKVTIIGN